MTEAQINALACALAVLRGTDGGYGPQEKANAITELQKMFEVGIKQLEGTN